ncbi:hypothetical protein HDU76_009602 [Blyttiomyces sp. JEL0837]|nr:hypothetical protein HDU76_009602 [Blyttiomyces sp. JEL0837]
MSSTSTSTQLTTNQPTQESSSPSPPPTTTSDSMSLAHSKDDQPHNRHQIHDSPAAVSIATAATTPKHYSPFIFESAASTSNVVDIDASRRLALERMRGNDDQLHATTTTDDFEQQGSGHVEQQDLSDDRKINLCDPTPIGRIPNLQIPTTPSPSTPSSELEPALDSQTTEKQNRNHVNVQHDESNLDIPSSSSSPSSSSIQDSNQLSLPESTTPITDHITSEFSNITINDVPATTTTSTNNEPIAQSNNNTDTTTNIEIDINIDTLSYPPGTEIIKCDEQDIFGDEGIEAGSGKFEFKI